MQLHEARNSYNRPLRVYRTSFRRIISDVLHYLTLHEVADRIGITYNTAGTFSLKEILQQANTLFTSQFCYPPETVDTWMTPVEGSTARGFLLPR